MYLPMQREPVQRTLAGQPCAHQTSTPVDASNVHPSDQTFRASQYGVQPSGGVNWGDVLSTVMSFL
jgi:hypothetical protein